MSSRTLADRMILITGGTGGVGIEAARTLRANGAQIIIGSRDAARYATTAKDLGETGVHPFIADITDQDQIERQLDLLRANGLVPTDVIHSAAGGLEPILRDLARLMIGLQKLRGAERARAHNAARDELAVLVGDTRELAMTANYQAPSRLLDLLVPQLPLGGSVTFYSSLWSTFYPHPQVPIYYQNIAESKNAMERWLENRATGWASKRVTTAIISSTWIRDTRVGQVLDRFCAEPMPPADRDRWRSTYVTCSDLVEATVRIVKHSGPSAIGGLVRVFIPGPGAVADHMSPDDPPMHYRAMLAVNSPTWE